MTPESVAIENVERVLRYEITDPSPGTLAWRVLQFAKEYGQPTVTVRCEPMSELELGGGV